MDKVTIPEAAARLGLSENALRKRVHRGTIEHEKDEEGRVYVYLSPDMPPTMPDQADGQATDQADGQAINQAADQARLIARLEDEVEYLRREAEDWKEEARRKDTIIMTMAQRIPELEPAPGPRESPETASEGVEGVEVPIAEEKPSWWRRLFS
jgi:hypothetical protein